MRRSELIEKNSNLGYNGQMPRRPAANKYDLAALCREVREEEDLSVPEMAKLVEVSDDAYRNWEQGKSKPTAENFIDILNVRAKRRGMNLKGLLPFLK